MRQWIVTGTSMVVEAETAEEAIERAEQMSGWHWEATEVLKKGICLRHGGPWGEDVTCAMCTSAVGVSYPYGHMYGLSGMQLERYDALMAEVGDHDAALADARQWPAKSEDD